ncbi:MAG: SEC-C metal-binding domain-containing protein [Defluviitaleaceae bacterium]|nr:SEC-C metal-binding domain-containing protein [Defluviitaleaceae bacterium]
MALFDAWKRVAFDPQNQPVKHVWDEYLLKEKAVYENILENKITKVEGIIVELAEKFHLSNIQMCAFFDGIHECVDGLPEIGEIEDDTKIDIHIEFDRLYKQMVEYKADHLYSLKAWDGIFPAEKQKELYTEQKRSHTIVRNEAKIGRNDPCTCGSGKKYKKCCGVA